jgi:hypothetical protein
MTPLTQSGARPGINAHFDGQKRLHELPGRQRLA